MRKIRVFTLVALVLLAFAIGVTGCRSLPRKLLYFPSHGAGTNGLAEWKAGDRVIGLARIVPQPKNVWLLTHGNAGQAADRSYVLPCFSSDDSVYILEYPGYGLRPGAPSEESFNRAAREAYELLRTQFPHTPVCAAGESIGTGPASWLPGRPTKSSLSCPSTSSQPWPKIIIPTCPSGCCCPTSGTTSNH